MASFASHAPLVAFVPFIFENGGEVGMGVPFAFFRCFFCVETEEVDGVGDGGKGGGLVGGIEVVVFTDGVGVAFFPVAWREAGGAVSCLGNGKEEGGGGGGGVDGGGEEEEGKKDCGAGTPPCCMGKGDDPLTVVLPAPSPLVVPPVCR